MRFKVRQLVLTIGVAFLSYGVVFYTQAAETTSTLSTLIAQGDKQWAEGKLDLAQKTFEQAVNTAPQSVAALMKLAGLQFSRQEFASCIKTYQRTIGLDAKNAKAWIGLGFAYLHTGKHELSIAAFNEAIAIDPTNREKLAPLLDKLGAS